MLLCILIMINMFQRLRIELTEQSHTNAVKDCFHNPKTKDYRTNHLWLRSIVALARIIIVPPYLSSFLVLQLTTNREEREETVREAMQRE